MTCAFVSGVGQDGHRLHERARHRQDVLPGCGQVIDIAWQHADPHQRIYGNCVSLTGLGIAIRGRSRKLTVNYRTTQEILAWAVPLPWP